MFLGPATTTQFKIFALCVFLYSRLNPIPNLPGSLAVNLPVAPDQMLEAFTDSFAIAVKTNYEGISYRAGGAGDHFADNSWM
jgi:hypothetical protein